MAHAPPAKRPLRGAPLHPSEAARPLLALATRGFAAALADQRQLPQWPPDCLAVVAHALLRGYRFVPYSAAGQLTSIAFLDDGRLAACQPSINRVVILDPAGGAVAQEIAFPSKTPPIAVASLPGALAVAAGRDVLFFGVTEGPPSDSDDADAERRRPPRLSSFSFVGRQTPKRGFDVTSLASQPGRERSENAVLLCGCVHEKSVVAFLVSAGAATVTRLPGERAVSPTHTLLAYLSPPMPSPSALPSAGAADGAAAAAGGAFRVVSGNPRPGIYVDGQKASPAWQPPVDNLEAAQLAALTADPSGQATLLATVSIPDRRAVSARSMGGALPKTYELFAFFSAEAAARWRVPGGEGWRRLTTDGGRLTGDTNRNGATAAHSAHGVAVVGSRGIAIHPPSIVWRAATRPTV